MEDEMEGGLPFQGGNWGLRQWINTAIHMDQGGYFWNTSGG